MPADPIVLIINPGSTSTKVGVYQSGEMLFNQSLSHSTDELAPFDTIWDQYELRKNAVLGALAAFDVSLDAVDIIACRGGNIKPLPGGIYEVTPQMLADMKSGQYGKHPTNVGGLIGYDLGQQLGIPVLTMDPPMTDELCTSARYSGIPQITRLSSYHALNQKATGRKVAEKLGSTYDAVNLVVAHLGGGISVGAHLKGRVIDVNNALDGDGSFSPERAGTLPAGDLVKLCFSGDYSEAQVLKLLTGGGGLMAYLGTTSGIEIEQRIADGDAEAAEVFEAMIYQTAKEIGAAAAVLEGKVDAIAITGSLAYSETFIASLKRKVGFIAPIHLNPGENEMYALAEGVYRYSEGKEALSQYN